MNAAKAILRKVLSRRKVGPWRASPRWRRWLARVVLVFLVAVLAAYWYLTDDRRVRAFAQAHLGELTGRRVRIGQASFGLFDGLVLRDIEIASARGDSQPPAFEAMGVLIRFKPLPVLIGRFVPEEIVCTDPVISVEYDMSPAPAIPSRPAPARELPEVPSIPPGMTVRIRNARARVVYRRGAVVDSTAEVALNATMVPSGQGGHRLSFDQIVAGDARPLAGAVSIGGGDVSNLSVLVPVELVAMLLPPKWRDVSAPDGVGGALRITAGPDASDTLSVELMDISAKLPEDIGWMSVAGVSGRLLVDLTKRRITADGLVAAVPAAGGAEIELKGWWQGLGPGASCSIDAEVKHMELPDRPGKGEVAEIVRMVEADYSPEGSFDLSARFARAAGCPDDLCVTLRPKGVSATYSGFPHRVDNITGQIVFSMRGVPKIDLAGSSGETKVTIRGHLAEYSGDGDFEIVVDARDGRFDSQLRDALRVLPEVQALWPVLNPAGFANALVRVHQGAQDAQSAVEVTVSMDGRASMCFSDWPYPLTGLRGDVVVTDTDVRIAKVSGRAGRMRCTVDGTITKLQSDSPLTKLAIDISDMPIDETLLKALAHDSPEAADVVRSLHAAGQIETARVTVSQSGDAPVRYAVRATLEGASLTPEVFAYPFTDVSGELEVTPESVTIKDLQGRAGKGEFAMDVAMRIEGDEGFILERLDAVANRVALDAQLASALPKEAQEVWRTLSPTGRADVSVLLRANPDDADQLDYEVTVLPDRARVVYDEFPLPVDRIMGKVVMTPDLVLLEKLVGFRGDATIQLDGKIDISAAAADADATLAMKIRNLVVDKELIAAAAKAVPELSRRFSPGGTVRVDLKELRLPGGGAWTVAGGAAFNDLCLDLGLSSKTVSGKITDASAGGDKSGLALEGKLALDCIQAGGRQMTDLSGRVSKRRDRPLVLIRDIEGKAHGGEVFGAADIRLTDPVQYGISLRVADIDLADLINAGVADPSKRSKTKGRLTGKIEMRAVSGKSELRYGGGRLRITDANISKLPVLLELLHLVQLQLPGNTAFAEADVVYSLKGDKVHFDSIDLSGPALSFSSRNGRLDLATGKLRLIFLGLPGKLPPMSGIPDAVVRRILGELFVVKVTGTISEPKQTSVALPRGWAFVKKVLSGSWNLLEDAVGAEEKEGGADN